MELLAAIERLGIVATLKASFFAYPLVNALHIASVGALLTSVLAMDVRLLGGFASVPAAPFVGLLRRIAIAAFLGAAFSGVLLFSVRASEYAAMPLFLAKMTLIVLGLVNFAVFARLSAAAELGNVAAPGMRALLWLSMLIWPSVLICGRFLGFL